MLWQNRRGDGVMNVLAFLLFPPTSIILISADLAVFCIRGYYFLNITEYFTVRQGTTLLVTFEVEFGLVIFSSTLSASDETSISRSAMRVQIYEPVKTNLVHSRALQFVPIYIRLLTPWSMVHLYVCAIELRLSMVECTRDEHVVRTHQSYQNENLAMPCDFGDFREIARIIRIAGDP